MLELCGAQKAILLDIVDGLPSNFDMVTVLSQQNFSAQYPMISSNSMKDISACENVVTWVLKNKRSLIMDDAQIQREIKASAYRLKENVKSILCIPLIAQGKMEAMVYLENNLATHVFHRGRVPMIQLLGIKLSLNSKFTKI